MGGHRGHGEGIRAQAARVCVESTCRWDAIAALPVASRSEHCVHVRTDKPFSVLMDGRKGHGAVERPGLRLTGDEKTDTIYCV